MDANKLSELLGQMPAPSKRNDKIKPITPEGILADVDKTAVEKALAEMEAGGKDVVLQLADLLADVIKTNMTSITSLECPVILLEGRHDYNVNAQLAAEWFAKVKAPAKQFVWFEHSAHEPMNEEQGKFLVSLVRYARPFAEKAGDVAPDPGQPAAQKSSN